MENGFDHNKIHDELIASLVAIVSFVLCSEMQSC